MKGDVMGCNRSFTETGFIRSGLPVLVPALVAAIFVAVLVISPAAAQSQPWVSAADGKLLFTGDDPVTVNLARFGLKYASDPEMMNLQSRMSAGNSPSERAALVNAVIARGQSLDQSGSAVSQVWKDWQDSAAKSPSGSVNIQLSQQGGSTYASPSDNTVVVGLDDPSISVYDINSLASPVAHEMGHIERWYSGNTGQVEYGNDNVHFTSEITNRVTAFEEGFAEYRAHRALGRVDISSDRPYILFEAGWDQIPAALRNADLPSENINGTLYKQCQLESLPFGTALSVESVISRFLFHLASKVPGAAGRIDAILAGRQIDSIEQFLALYLAAYPSDAAAVGLILDADTGFTATPEELKALLGPNAAAYVDQVRAGLAGAWTFEGKEGIINSGLASLSGAANTAAVSGKSAAAAGSAPVPPVTASSAATGGATPAGAIQPAVVPASTGSAANPSAAVTGSSANPGAVVSGFVMITMTFLPDGGILIQAEGPTMKLVKRALAQLMSELGFVPALARRARPMDPQEYAAREAALGAPGSGVLLDGSTQGTATQSSAGSLK